MAMLFALIFVFAMVACAGIYAFNAWLLPWKVAGYLERASSALLLLMTAMLGVTAVVLALK